MIDVRFARFNPFQPLQFAVQAAGRIRARALAIVAVIISVASAHLALAATPDAPLPEKAQTYDYVILALSWSPSYCASDAKRAATAQCQNPANRGFVLHGLWPQANDGTRLRCPNGKANFSKALFERALEVFPDLGLAQSQWQRHGQCFGFAPDAYLERAQAARAKLAIPERFRGVEQPLSIPPQEIRTSFINANPGLTAESISVSCRKEQLVEVLVCMKSDLSGFISCPQVAKRSCRASTVQIPASLTR